MKKEVIIAIIVGFSLGLVITYGIYRARTSINDRNLLTQTDQQSPGPELRPPADSHTLSITSHTPHQLVDTDEVQISGLTHPGSMIALLSPQGENIATADDQGNYAATVKLAPGENILTIRSHHPYGAQVEQTISLIYSTADLDQEVTP